MCDEVLAIIPARGGSKGIPKKNIKLLGEVPLIAYSIAAGLQAKKINRLIVSTDDEEIAAYAKEYGASVPFRRPKEFAEDHVTDFIVFQHALEWLKKNEGYQPDIIVQLRPTSPFRTPSLIDDSVEILQQNPNADCVRAVSKSGEDPYKMWRIEDGRMIPLMESRFDEPYNMPRQKLPETFWQTGHIDSIRYGTIIEKKSMTGDLILPIIIDRKYAVDIDNEEQWLTAEIYLNILKESNSIVI